MKCEHCHHCQREASLLHTIKHADCLPGLPIGVTVAVCELHSCTRSETLRAVFERGMTFCALCLKQLDATDLVAVEPIPEWSNT